VGIALARHLEGEVISIDSRKVYRGLPVGTASPAGTWKDGALVVEGIPHHLIGHLPPDEGYTAGDFAKDAERLISDILARGRTPVLVGGTGFYFKALQVGLPPLPTRDDRLREYLEDRAAKEGWAALHAELAERDPASAKVISPNDPHKIIRALEVTHVTGQPFSTWKNHDRVPSPHRFAVMGLHVPKPDLERKIAERARWMADHGMIDETKALVDNGVSPACPALASFGYREAVQVVQGTLPRADFVPLLIKGTNAYAKRQRTWFRTQTKPVWFDLEKSTPAEEIALKMNDFLNTIAK
jgi:tRNA dimethylallyltransferase